MLKYWALLLSMVLAPSAQVVCPLDSHRQFYDATGVIHPTNIMALENRLLELRDSGFVDMAVVILPEMHSDQPNQFTADMFKVCQLGQAHKDNGLLLLVTLSPRFWRFETGYGLESTLPDQILGRIAQERMLPLFRKELFANGIQEAIVAVDTLVHQGELNFTRSIYSDEKKSSAPWWLAYGANVLGILLLCLLPQIVHSLKLYNAYRNKDYTDAIVRIKKGNNTILKFIGLWGVVMGVGLVDFVLLFLVEESREWMSAIIPLTMFLALLLYLLALHRQGKWQERLYGKLSLVANPKDILVQSYAQRLSGVQAPIPAAPETRAPADPVTALQDTAPDSHAPRGGSSGGGGASGSW